VGTSTRSRRAALAGPRPLSWADVLELGLQLPNTEESIAWGTPVLRLNGNIFAALPIHKSAEPGSLSVHCETSVRDAMIEEQPDIYYTAAHYENYPVVLVRMARITRDILDGLLRMSHKHVSRKPPNRRAKTKTARKRRK
jgi:hypothetical protein